MSAIDFDCVFFLSIFSLNSLFSIPRNKRFVCVNTDTNIRVDPLTQSINILALYIKAKEEKAGVGVTSDENDSDDDIRPFKGFAKPLSHYKRPSTTRSNEYEQDQPTNRLLSLIDEHVEEALDNGFDDSIAKFKGKSHFVVRTRLVVNPFSISECNELKLFSDSVNQIVV